MQISLFPFPSDSWDGMPECVYLYLHSQHDDSWLNLLLSITAGKKKKKVYLNLYANFYFNSLAVWCDFGGVLWVSVNVPPCVEVCDCTWIHIGLVWECVWVHKCLPSSSCLAPGTAAKIELHFAGRQPCLQLRGAVAALYLLTGRPPLSPCSRIACEPILLGAIRHTDSHGEGGRRGAA